MLVLSSLVITTNFPRIFVDGYVNLFAGHLRSFDMYQITKDIEQIWYLQINN